MMTGIASGKDARRCAFDTWDVVCKRCGARTSQFATRDFAVKVWNAMRTLAELRRLASEVRALCDAHDGIHNLHGAAANVECWVRNAEDYGLDTVDWDNVDLMVRQSRAAAATGFWPKDF